MSIKRRRGGQSSEWLRKVNQEDLLAEIAERLQLELNSAGMTAEAFSKRLGRPSGYVEELLDGLVNISVRELADVFSIFDKIVALNLISSNAGYKEVRSHINIPRENRWRLIDKMEVRYTHKHDPSTQFFMDVKFTSHTLECEHKNSLLMYEDENILNDLDLEGNRSSVYEF